MGSYKDLKAKELYESVKCDESIKVFLPNYTKKQVPCKKFLLNVINTVYPGKLKEMRKERLKTSVTVACAWQGGKRSRTALYDQ